MKTRRDQLQQLSKDELIEVILSLEARVVALEGQQKRPRKTPRNSSKPSGQSPKGERRQRRAAKRGPKAGHAGKSRERSEPDMIVACQVEHCEQCGEHLEGAKHYRVGSSQIVEIPPIRPLVIEAQRYAARCPNCQYEQAADYPMGFEPQRVFGPNLETLVHYLHLAHPLSYQRVQRIARDVLGLEISVGALVNAVRRGYTALQNAATSIRDAVRASPVIGSDETGIRVGGHNHWQWVFQTPQHVYFHIASRRNAAVLQTVMADSCPVTWVSDLAPAQLKHPAIELQICLAHQVRDLQWSIDTDRCAWAYHFQALLYRAMRLGQQRDNMPPQAYAKQVQTMEQTCNYLLSTPPIWPDSRRLHRRFLKHRQSLFVFLYRHNVPPTNNASEQALRNSVIYRKVTGGFRTSWGATIYANAASIFETARRQGLDILQTLRSVLNPTQFPLFAVQRE